MSRHWDERPPVHTWTDEDVSWLKQLWADGRTCSQIASELGCGLTRSAIIGKVHRLKLPLRKKPVRPRRAPGPATKRAQYEHRSVAQKARRMREQISATASPAEPLGEAPEFEAEAMPSGATWAPLPGTNPVPLLAATGCLWPIGEDGPFLFCNAPRREGGGSYCPYHASRASYMPSRSRPDRLIRLAVLA